MFKIRLSHLYIFPLTLLLCVILLGSSFMGFLSASDNGTLYIKDIKGDRSVLDDVVISGVLQDRSHGTKFEIQNNEIDQTFSFYESDEGMVYGMNNYNSGNVLQQGDISYSYNTEYSISPKANIETSTEIRKDENGVDYKEITRAADMADVYVLIQLMDYRRRKVKWERIRFNPGASIKSDKQIFETTEEYYYDETGRIMHRSSRPVGMVLKELTGVNYYANSTNAFVMLDGSIYFTVLSTPIYEGTNGIYKVEGFSSDWLSLGYNDRVQYGQVKTITTFSLDEQDLTVLGLKVVNNNLVLILLDNGVLKIRSYHPESGNIINELEVTSLTDTEVEGNMGSFIDGDRLNLSISKTKEKNGEISEPTTLMVSVKIEDDITLLHLVENLDINKGEKHPIYLDQMYEVNGKLFVFSYLPAENEQENPYGLLLPEPEPYMMFVYQDGNLLYKGELINDSHEDYIANKQRALAYDYSHNNYQYRRIGDLKVRGAMTEMIELKGVRKYYGTAAVGLSRVTTEIKTGEIVGILGENGTGKTTMLKVIMGLTDLTEGQVLIDGKLPAEKYNEMAFITEEGSFFPEMTPREYGEFLSVFFDKFDMTRYYKLLKFFELDDYKKIKTFSNGQKSKLEISAGFAKGAKYILMDEPFLGKDMLTRRDFLKLMISSLREDETILISTHQLNEIENFIDRAIILRYGFIKADFYMDEIKEQGKNLYEIMMEVTGYDENRYKSLFTV